MTVNYARASKTGPAPDYGAISAFLGEPYTDEGEEILEAASALEATDKINSDLRAGLKGLHEYCEGIEAQLRSAKASLTGAWEQYAVVSVKLTEARAEALEAQDKLDRFKWEECQ